MYCTICLDDSYNVYHNICKVCNNSVCSVCLNSVQVKSMSKCSVCRNKLEKKFKLDVDNTLFAFHFFRHVFFHILVNIIFTNITFMYNFPDYIDNILVPQNKSSFMFLLNYCNIIVLPTVYIVDNCTRLNYIYTFMNFILCQLISNGSSSDIRMLYNLYCSIYLYSCCILHATILCIKFLYKHSVKQIKKCTEDGNYYSLISYNITYNTSI